MLFRETKITLKTGENGQEGGTRSMIFKPKHELGKGGLTQIAGKHTNRGRLPMAVPGSGARDQGQPVHGSRAHPTEGAGSWVRRGDGIRDSHLASDLNDKVAGH